MRARPATPNPTDGQGPRESPAYPKNGQAFHRRPPKSTALEFEVTPQAVAASILQSHAGTILVVRPVEANGLVSGWHEGDANLRRHSCAYWLGDNGRWEPGPEPWYDLVDEVLWERYQRAEAAYAQQERSKRAVLRSIKTEQRRVRSLAREVRVNIRSAAQRMREDDPDAVKDLTECQATELDADRRYLGVANGVVDLCEAKLLKPAEARTKLVTVSTGIDYDPNAKSDDVDLLTKHLPEDEQGWWWQVMGYALHGRPSRRIYVIVGPPGGGKSCVANALRSALATYASEPADSALSESGSLGSHSTELSAFASPIRVAVMDEANFPRGRLSASLVKRLSGDSTFTYRPLYKDPITTEATATLFLVCNPHSVPRMNLEDDALASRLRELPYPAVPDDQKDPELPDRLRTKEFRRAMLARLVSEASELRPGYPPEDIPTVSEATDARIENDIGELGRFARRLVPAPSTKLAFPDVWKEWCEMNGVQDPSDAPKAGGITRRSFTRLLRKQVPALPGTKSVSIDGKTVRGWVGWEFRPDDTSQV